MTVDLELISNGVGDPSPKKSKKKTKKTVKSKSEGRKESKGDRKKAKKQAKALARKAIKSARKEAKQAKNVEIIDAASRDHKWHELPVITGNADEDLEYPWPEEDDDSWWFEEVFSNSESEWEGDYSRFAVAQDFWAIMAGVSVEQWFLQRLKELLPTWEVPSASEILAKSNLLALSGTFHAKELPRAPAGTVAKDDDLYFEMECLRISSMLAQVINRVLEVTDWGDNGVKSYANATFRTLRRLVTDGVAEEANRQLKDQADSFIERLLGGNKMKHWFFLSPSDIPPADMRRTFQKWVKDKNAFTEFGGFEAQMDGDRPRTVNNDSCDFYLKSYAGCRVTIQMDDPDKGERRRRTALGRNGPRVITHVYARIRIPAEYAKWVCQSAVPTQDKMFEYINAKINGWAAQYIREVTGMAPEYVDQGDVYAPNRYEEQLKDTVVPLPFANEDHLTLTAEGEFYYYPPADSSTYSQFEANRQEAAGLQFSQGPHKGENWHSPAAVSQLGHSSAVERKVKYENEEQLQTGNADIGIDAIPESAFSGETGLTNQVLYQDPYLGVIHYVTSSGEKHSDTTDGWVPVDKHHYEKLLCATSYNEAGGPKLTNLTEILGQLAEEAGFTANMADFLEPDDFAEFGITGISKANAVTDLMNQMSRVFPGGGDYYVEVFASDLLEGSNNPYDFAEDLRRMLNFYVKRVGDRADAEAAFHNDWPEDTEYGREPGKVDGFYGFDVVEDEGLYRWYRRESTAECTAVEILRESTLAWLHRYIKALDSHVNGDYTQFFGKGIAFTPLTTLLPSVIVLAELDSYRQMRDIIKEHRETLNITEGYNTDYEVAPIPNIGEGKQFLPQQVKVDSKLANDPKHAVLNVDTGGGKTVNALADALRALKRGERVIILCPNKLIPNYPDDAYRVLGAKINFLIFSTEVYNREGGPEMLYNNLMNAPGNTIVVAGFSLFNAVDKKQFQVSGDTWKTLFGPVELLRRIPWDRIIIDESHKIKSPGTVSYGSMARLLSSRTPRPVVRQMTATYIHRDATDVAGQGRLMDPALLPKDTAFLEQWVQELGRSGKVVQWHPNATKDIREILDQETDYVQIKRREWQGLLPNRIEEIHIVNMEDRGQLAAYTSLRDSLLAQLFTDAQIKKLMENGLQGDAKAEEDASTGKDGEDDSEEDASNKNLTFFVAKLESFLSSPQADKFSDLTEEIMSVGDTTPDPEFGGKPRCLISPKVREVDKILTEHFADPKNGKVLIFCSWKPTRDALVDDLSAMADGKKWADKIVKYEANRFQEQRPILEKDPEKTIIIAVENSLNTGLNLQVANRIIRMESVWNPGDMEQGEGRINRPDKENLVGTDRATIYVDWLITDSSVDVTKMSRLIARMVHSQKFEAQGDKWEGNYAEIPNLPVISMSPEMIAVACSYHDEVFVASDGSGETYSMKDYVDGYKKMNDIREEEIDEFLNSPDRAFTEMGDIPQDENIEGSTLLLDLPYTQNMVIPYQRELGLENAASWAAENVMSIRDLSVEDLNEAGFTRVHTENGDGTLVKSSTRTFSVELDDGGVYRFNKSAVFLIPSEQAGQGPIRNRIALMTGLPLERPVTSDGTGGILDLDEAPGAAGLTKFVWVRLVAVNGIIMLLMDPPMESEGQAPYPGDNFGSIGFMEGGPYYYLNCDTVMHFESAYNALKKAHDARAAERVRIPAKSWQVLDELWDRYEENRSGQYVLRVPKTKQRDIRNFFLEKVRKSNPPQVRVYPVVFDYKVRLMAWADKQPAATRLLEVRGTQPTTRWTKETNSFFFKVCPTKAVVKKTLKQLAELGYDVYDFDSGEFDSGEDESELRRKLKDFRVTVN